jgi:hypothetical protein
MKPPRVPLLAARRWAVDEAPARLVIAASALLGAVLALRTFGLHYLLGDGPFWSWPSGDASMMLTGWSYFVHEPWRWPLGQTYATNGAAGINILYLDTIPLVAVLGKLARSIFGGSFHPYGLWHGAIYVLQAIFAALLARTLGLRSVIGGLGMALLALSMHMFTQRFYHEGLNGHFVLLWALLVYFRSTPDRRALPLAAEWAACLSCSVLLHPYLGAMSGALALAGFARVAIVDLRRAAIVAASASAFVLLVLVVFGYVPQSVPRDPGLFGMASLNLVSLVLPLHSTLVPSLPSLTTQDMTGVQWDGNGFLGVGVWLLLLASLFLASRAVRDHVKHHKPLVLALLCLALYAPSNRAWLGKSLLWHFELPAFVAPSLGNLAATGRFFWPVAYALLVGACVMVHRRFGAKGTLAIGAAALLQLVDNSAIVHVVTATMAAPGKRELDWNAWRPELATAPLVNIYPSFWCWPGPPPFPDREIQAGREVEFLAASMGKHTNAGRAGRAITDCAKELPERSAAAAGSHRAGELYVFFKPAFTAELVTTLGAERCRDMGDAIVCRTRR